MRREWLCCNKAVKFTTGQMEMSKNLDAGCLNQKIAATRKGRGYFCYA
jgi:hypothetical protein